MTYRDQSPFRLDRVIDQIYVRGAFGPQDVRKVFAAIHDAVNNRGFSDLLLDFSDCELAFSSAMLPLCAYVLRLRQSRIDFRLLLPKREELRRLFINTGWAHYLCPRDNGPPANNYRRQFAAIQYSTHDEQEALLNDLLERLLAVIPQFNRGDFAAVEWALNEITDNVLNHSQSPIGGLLQLSVFEESKRRVEFTVADAGLGVPATLRASRREIENDMDALMESVKSGVTRNVTDFQGNGLYGTLEICRAGGGRFSLQAGNASLIHSGGVLNPRSERVPFTGTTIDALIDFSQPGLLEKALEIGGAIHHPVDYIELQYEQEGLESVVFRVAEQGSSFRSRPSGRPIKTKLSNLVSACAGQQMLVDFSGVSVISSSFADEVFGKLFVELGPMNFMLAIRFVNITPTVQGLIDRAIRQRMATPG